MIFVSPDDTSVRAVAQVIQVAIAPVFLLSGICTFLNVCVTRVSRTVDRSRVIEPLLLQSKGTEHRHLRAEMQTLDQRLSLINRSIFLSVLSAVLICVVVALLFAATLFEPNFGRAIALLFIASMLAIGVAFAVFLAETRVATRSMRVRPEILAHAPDGDRSAQT